MKRDSSVSGALAVRSSGPFEAGMYGSQQLAHARHAPGLVLADIAPARHQQADGDGDLLIGPDVTQAGARAYQIGDDAGFARIPLSLAAGKAAQRG